MGAEKHNFKNICARLPADVPGVQHASVHWPAALQLLQPTHGPLAPGTLQACSPCVHLAGA
eukprot:361231-Chlamydomonas_euryale.AAC.7